jgi:phage shock protein PspC (stress-responsive transcriptional regulator)
MVRSFSDRVFGGVCGGLAASLRINSWLVRALFAALTIASLGAFLILYLLLWWITPQESVSGRRVRSLSLLIVFLLIALMIGVWIAREQMLLVGPSGEPLFWPIMLTALAAVFFLRQLVGRRA